MSTVPSTFLKQAGKILNSGQARTLLLTGNIHDLFFKKTGDSEDYVPLLPFLVHHWDLPNFILIIHELNGPIRFLHDAHAELMKRAWVKWRTGLNSEDIAIQRMLNKGQGVGDLHHVESEFEQHLQKAIGKPTLALELLRQMCLCSRSTSNGKPILEPSLLILIEGADLLLPESPISQLSDVGRQRVAICQDWFSDQGFLRSEDSVIMLAESRSQIHHRVANLPTSSKRKSRLLMNHHASISFPGSTDI
jgi:hypothetical protein